MDPAAFPGSLIRPERPTDHEAIDALLRKAFGGESEAVLVQRIRAGEGFDPRLALVAVHSGDEASFVRDNSRGSEEVIGHILFSPVRIEGAQRTTPALALAPMAVLPAWQRRGVGSALVRAGLDACRRLGHRIIIVLGHAEYYPRFGFRPAAPLGIRAPWNVPDEVFMALELAPGALEGVSGMVRYPAAFDGL